MSLASIPPPNPSWEEPQPVPGKPLSVSVQVTLGWSVAKAGQSEPGHLLTGLVTGSGVGWSHDSRQTNEAQP